MTIKQSNRAISRKGPFQVAILAGALLALIGCQGNPAATTTGTNGATSMQLQLTQDWDKTFAQSEKVEHRKVTFINRYGITLAAYRRSVAVLCCRPSWSAVRLAQ